MMNKSYYAIIPANVRYDNDLTPNAKLLYGEITALCNQKGYCWASNEYFANLYGKRTETISRWISSLDEKGYIKRVIEYEADNRTVKNRYLSLTDTKKSIGIDENINTLLTKKSIGIDENVKENTTYNTTFNNTENILSDSNESDRMSYHEVVKYLNDKAGTQYRPTTRKTQSLIKARFHEGFTLDDFKKVVDTKVDEWGRDREMSKYLRPETLFGTKFESYLNQYVSQPKGEYDDLF